MLKYKKSSVVQNQQYLLIVKRMDIGLIEKGKWYYEKIKKEHSVKQVQNRDMIKIKEIESLGYTPYVIKDIGFSAKLKIRFGSRR